MKDQIEALTRRDTTAVYAGEILQQCMQERYYSSVCRRDTTAVYAGANADAILLDRSVTHLTNTAGDN